MMTQSFCYAGSGKFPFGIEDIIKASETSLEEIEKEFEVSKWPFKSRKKINFENI